MRNYCQIPRLNKTRRFKTDDVDKLKKQNEFFKLT